MRVDVAVTYYRQSVCIPYLMLGLGWNAGDIHRVFIMNDESWSNVEEACLRGAGYEAGINVVPMWQEHNGYGVARSFNKMLRVADTEYVFMMSADQVLPKDALAKALAHATPKKLVVGAVHEINLTPCEITPHMVETGEFPLLKEEPSGHQPRFYNQTWRSLNAKETIAKGCAWKLASNAHTVVRREDHRFLGGFDERFCALGYGLEDAEFGARFMGEFGTNSIVWSDSFSHQFKELYPGQREKVGTHQVEDANWRLLKDTLLNHSLNTEGIPV